MKVMFYKGKNKENFLFFCFSMYIVKLVKVLLKG